MAMKFGAALGSSYARMPHQQTDMSNRTTHPPGWNFRSMSMILKIAVMMFVSMLCVVLFVGAFGLISGRKERANQLEGEEMAAKWLIDLNNPNSDGKQGYIIYSDPQADLERPTFVQYFKKQAQIEDPFASLAQERLEALSALRSRNLTFIINVIGWRRRASLKRLVKSLENANYHGFTTRLHFHLDGEAHPFVKEYVEEYVWPHGKTMMNIHTERLGLESTIVHSWDARSDNQLAFFFEDDIEVSPNYFEYTMLNLHKYIYPDPDGPRSTSYLASKMMGIALNTPRFNEIVYPPYRWVPQHVIGQDDYQFAFQLANSWGCLYFPWIWREYRQYYDWRKNAGLELREIIIPNTFINNWLRSWKKSLIELSYFRGYYMIYPNLPGQHGFSIHHREPGEHTKANAEEPEVDLIIDVYLDYFTIPLVTNQRDINRLYATMTPLGELPTVNFHHAAVKSIYQLAPDGLPAVQNLQKYGFDFDRFNPNPGCILDNLTPPILEDDGGEKYLVYQGQGSAHEQLDGLEGAFAYAKILNRTLIIPPLTYDNPSKKKFQQATWDWLIEMNNLTGEGSWTKAVLMDSFSTNVIWLDRIVEFGGKKESQTQMNNDKLFDAKGIVPMRDVVLPRVQGSSSEIRILFGTCHDKFLAFRSMHNAFNYHQGSATEVAFRQWSYSSLALKKQFRDAFEELFQTFTKPFACVTFTKGDDPGDCGRGVAFPSEDVGKLVIFRSCNATAPRTIEYLMEAAGKQSIQPLSIYVYTDAGTSPSAIPTSIGSGSIKIPILRSNMVAEALKKRGLLHHEIKHMSKDVQLLFEERLCIEADVFLGTVFSEFALKVARLRRVLGKTTDILGYGTDHTF